MALLKSFAFSASTSSQDDEFSKFIMDLMSQESLLLFQDLPCLSFNGDLSLRMVKRLSCLDRYAHNFIKLFLCLCSLPVKWSGSQPWTHRKGEMSKWTVWSWLREDRNRLYPSPFTTSSVPQERCKPTTQVSHGNRQILGWSHICS